MKQPTPAKKSYAALFDKRERNISSKKKIFPPLGIAAGGCLFQMTGIAALVSLGAYCVSSYISRTDTAEYPKDSSRYEDIGMKILVDKEKEIHSGDLMTIDVKVTDAEMHQNQDLTVRYFMLNNTYPMPKEAADFYDRLIYIGERNDLEVDASGNGVISGVFEYDPTIELTFVEDTALINPMDDTDAQKAAFKFLVEVWDGNKKLDYKWWGNEKQDEYLFTFIDGTEAQEEPVGEHIPSDGTKHVFMYNQALGSTYLEAETLEVADYWHPHLYEFRLKKGELVMGQRCSEKLENKIKKKAAANNVLVLPMVSAFKKPVIDAMLQEPDIAAQAIADEIKEENYAGVALDLESISLGKESSTALVAFVHAVREQLPADQYEIAVAVSPRFAGSAENGYPHHGFYDFEGLAKDADWIELMAYDFHKGRRGISPILPEDKIDDIVAYAQAHVPNEKIVFLMPLYGYVWTARGARVGTISARNNERYSQEGTQQYQNGELYITTKDRVVYTQDGAVYNRRLQLLEPLGVNNVGGWRQTHATPEIFGEFANWKQK